MGTMIRQSMRRTFLSKRFFFALFGTVAMCYFCAREFLDPNCSSVYVIDVMLNLGLLKKVLVFFAAAPAVTLYCQDQNSGFIHSIVVRSGIKKYTRSSLLACGLSGFASLFLGLFLFFGILSIFCPVMPYEAGGIYDGIARSLPILYTFIEISIFSLYCTMWTMVGFALSSVIPNPYVALGSPLIFGYLFEELTSDLPTYLNLYRLSHCENVFSKSAATDYLYTMGVFLLVAVLSGVMFSYFAERRNRNEMV
ncbi:MAG: hypothetical protein J5379_08790 [Clostridiales bacterium]|nr:hypothetical protein [Clostridiales bacterium]